MKRLLTCLLIVLWASLAVAATMTVKLVWMPSPDAVSYKVGYTKGTAAYPPSTSWAYTAGTGIDIANLVTGATYKFKVRAVSDLGLESGDSNEVAVGAFPPAPPTALSATVIVLP